MRHGKYFFRSLFIPLLTPQIPPWSAVSPVVNPAQSKRKNSQVEAIFNHEP